MQAHRRALGSYPDNHPLILYCPAQALSNNTTPHRTTRPFQENETACAYYTFAFSEVQENGDQFLRCREGYVGADGVLAHLENVGELLDAMVGKTVDVHSVEVLGPKDDIAKLKEPLKDFNPMYFELAEGGLDTTNAGTSE